MVNPEMVGTVNVSDGFVLLKASGIQIHLLPKVCHYNDYIKSSIFYRVYRQIVVMTILDFSKLAKLSIVVTMARGGVGFCNP